MPNLWQNLQQAAPPQPQGLWGNLAQTWAMGGQPKPQQQVLSPSDNLSVADQMRARQQMLQMRDATNIRTINPGASWAMDRNTMLPDDVMSDSYARHLRQEDI